MKPLLGLYREKENSPGRHESNDRLILEQIAERLRERGLAVDLLSLDQAEIRGQEAPFVFSMCQGKPALERLLAWEKNGARIINRPQSARNTHRDRLPAIMSAAGLPFPQTELISTHKAGQPLLGLDGGVWLKRGDVHASVSADVQKIDSREQLGAGLADFAERGIEQAVLQAHRAGDEIKFYGVDGDTFFHWFYSGTTQRFPFVLEELRGLAQKAAGAAGLDIFGGDVIVSRTGELSLIDLNDWPSFAPCRDEAAHAIADLMTRRFHAD